MWKRIKLKKARRAVTRRPMFNPLYVYWRARQLEGTQNDGPEPGVFFINNYRVRTGWGNVPSTVYPYDATVWPPNEPSGLDRIGKYHRTSHYQRLFSLLEIKLCILERESVQISLPITKQWYEATGGLISTPASVAEFIEVHAVLIVGYDDNKQILKFRNSWKPTWGDDGCGYLPYEYFDKHVMEVWHCAPFAADRPKKKHRKATWVIQNWGLKQPWLNNVVHCMEIHDGLNDEKAAWMIVIQDFEYNELRVDDLYVRPEYRRRGLATRLCREALDASNGLNLPIRFLIADGDIDTKSANISAINNFVQKMGLHVRWNGEFGIKYIVEPGNTTGDVTPSQNPSVPPGAFLSDELEHSIGLFL